MTGKTLQAILTLLTIAVLILSAVLLAGIFFPEDRIVTPRIDPVVSEKPPIPVTSSYLFQEGMVTISVSVNSSVYEGAKSADKSVTIIGNITESDWIADSYRAMVDDPAQESLYQDLLFGFRKIRIEKDLDSDEYLELIAVYVQSLQYETFEENPAKFPVETVVDRAGDCDDKSLLLAGLLSREGYSVALLSFGPENHMALGIGSDDCQYRHTNYTFLETTNVSYVGVVTEKLGTGVSLYSAPIIIPIGNGDTTYTRCADTRYIHETMVQSGQSAKELESLLEVMQEDLKRKQQEILEMESRLQYLRSAGNVRQYNALVSTHNTRVSAYNDSLRSYQQLFTRYEKYVMVHNYIIDHEYDRKGVLHYIKMNLPV
ncbi:MAG: hypothetical protein CVV32_08650 [Methanomicrobiales archaeon HGW-Methanomicrobiales-3]|nr:MAG: hypothetical protein CVV32_08650 [Methanomicrobiales archaeon HGW-Methanomicrobiales-3]